MLAIAQDLARWAHAEGVLSPKLELTSTGAGFAVVTVGEVEAGASLVRLPSRLAATAELLRQEPEARRVSPVDPKQDVTIAVTLPRGVVETGGLVVMAAAVPVALEGLVFAWWPRPLFRSRRSLAWARTLPVAWAALVESNLVCAQATALLVPAVRGLHTDSSMGCWGATSPHKWLCHRGI